MDRYQMRVLRLREHVLKSKLEENDTQEESDNTDDFAPAEDNDTEETKTEEKEPVIFKVGIDDISKDKIIEILTRKCIEFNPRDKKEVLYNLMIEGE